MLTETDAAPGLAVRRGRKIGIGFALAATLAWSTTGLLIEVLSRDYHLSAIEISLWRTVFIAGLLGPIVWQREGWQGFALSWREGIIYAFNGVIGIAVFNVAWSSSVQTNGAAVATTLIYCAPVFVALGSWPLLGESIGLDRALAILVNISGCALVAGITNPVALYQSPGGLLLGLASGFTFGLYTLISKLTARKGRRSGLSSLFYFIFFGMLALLPWGLIQEGSAIFSLPLDGFGWFILALLAYGPTLGGYLFFNFSLKYLPAAVASLFTTMEPPITSVLSFFLLGRGITLIQWLGVLLIISGVVGLQLNGLRLSLKNRANK